MVQVPCKKNHKMLTQRIFFAKIIPTLDTLLLLSSGNFLSFPTTITTTPIKILQFKKKNYYYWLFLAQNLF